MEQGIEVYRYYYGGRDLEEIWVIGHANTAPHGQDIVCAGVSALAQSILYGLNEHTKARFTHEAKPGYIHVKMLSQNERARALLGTLVSGLVQMALAYPNTIKFKEGTPE
jgi:uncharacterized protein YsxB (DUF464 family)